MNGSREAKTSVRRWATALGAVALTGALATGCGIRPTAVPVDAGAPASRTACPSPVHPPAVPATSSAGPLHLPARPPLPEPAVSATPTTTAAPAGSLFSALPSADANGNATLRCG